MLEVGAAEGSPRARRQRQTRALRPSICSTSRSSRRGRSISATTATRAASSGSSETAVDSARDARLAPRRAALPRLARGARAACAACPRARAAGADDPHAAQHRLPRLVRRLGAHPLRIRRDPPIHPARRARGRHDQFPARGPARGRRDHDREPDLRARDSDACVRHGPRGRARRAPRRRRRDLERRRLRRLGTAEGPVPRLSLRPDQPRAEVVDQGARSPNAWASRRTRPRRYSAS